MIRVGIVGFGKMGQIRANAIKANGKGKVIAVYDSYQNTNFGDYYVAKSSHELMINQDIDALFICTPNHLNKPLTIEGLKHGKHVFCEKPPAFSAHEMEEVRQVEAQSGKVLMYGFNHRQHESIQRIKSLVDSGEYGKILWMRGRYGKSVDENFYKNWRAKKEMAGGGILMDQGIHMLDLFLYLGGDFHQVQAFISNLYWNLEIEDNAFIQLKNSSSGLVASMHSTMTQWRHLFSFEIFLERGYMVLNGLNTSSGTYGEEILSIAKNRTTAPAATWVDEERTVYQTDTSWSSEVNHFFNAIESNRPLEIGNSEDALKLMTLMDKIYKDAK